MFLLKKSASLVGLDIQPEAIYLVQLKKIKTQVVLEKIAEHTLPESIFYDTKIVNWDKLSAELYALVQSLSLQGCKAALQLSSNLTRTQHIKVPQGLTSKVIYQEIKQQVQRDSDLNEKLCVDFHLRELPDGYIDVHFAVTRQAYVSRYLRCINQAGLKTSIIDIDIYAIIRVIYFYRTTVLKKQEVFAALYVGLKSIILIIADNDQILFYESWKNQNTNFTHELSNKLQLFSAVFHQLKISEFIFCGNSHFKDEVNSVISQPCSFHAIDWRLPLAATTVSQNLISPYWIAIGLALRI